MKRIYLSTNEKKLAGVCGGIGEYFDLDPSIVRIGWIVLTVLSGVIPGILAYVIAAVLIPKEKHHESVSHI